MPCSGNCECIQKLITMPAESFWQWWGKSSPGVYGTCLVLRKPEIRRVPP